MAREVGKPPLYASWEEKPVRLTRGNRLLHFVLQTVDGANVLAAVGSERSARHMIFAIPDTFRYPLGAKKVPRSKYRTRRELEAWLESLIEFTPPAKRRRMKKDDLAAGCLSVSKAGLTVKDEPVLASEPDYSTCGKHEDSFSIPERSSVKVGDGDVALWSFVEATCNGRTRIAYFKRLIYENDLKPRASLQWFENSQDLKDYYAVEVPDAQDNELFFTASSDAVPIEAVKGVVTVLSQAHFTDRSSGLLPREKSRCFMCYRKVGAGAKIRRIRIERFQGYFSQGVLAQAGSDDAAEVPGKPSQLKRPRTQRVTKQKLLAYINSPERKCSALSLNFSDSDVDADEADGRVEDEGQAQPQELARVAKREMWDASVGSLVEVLSDDVSQLCWQPAEVVSSRPLEVKVRYLASSDTSSEVEEEWVLSRQLGGTDKYGFRCSNRSCIRPYQLPDCVGHVFEDGELVDVRWRDRWWEGVAIHSWENGFVAVQLLGPGSIKFVRKKFLRQSREWVRGHWEGLNLQKKFAKKAACLHVDRRLRDDSELPADALAGPDSLKQNASGRSLGFLQYVHEIVQEALQREESCDLEQAHGVEAPLLNEDMDGSAPVDSLATLAELAPEATSTVGDRNSKQLWEEFSSCTPEGSLSSDLATHHKSPKEAIMKSSFQESQLKPSTCRDINLGQEGHLVLDMLSKCSEDTLQHAPDQEAVAMEVSSSPRLSDHIGCARARIGCASSVQLQQAIAVCPGNSPVSPNWLQLGLSTAAERPASSDQPKDEPCLEPHGIPGEAAEIFLPLTKAEPVSLMPVECMPEGICHVQPCTMELSDCFVQPRPPSTSPPATPPPPPDSPPPSPFDAHPVLQL